MEDPQVPMGTMVNILCCMCGVSIAPNPSNTCASCLAGRADVSRGISTEATLHQCRGCQRWHKDAGKWVACELESRELMALCLANVSGLKKTKNSGEKVRLVDAKWIWTEPHSMRLKCIECQAEFRQGSWRALVQVRQRVGHKRTFLYLEQLILKHGAHRGCLSIETFRDGMDFYFPDKGKAARFISFLENVVPIKVKTSKKLVGTDDKSNISNFKYTNLVEICPLCKDDLLYLPLKLARQLGNISRLVLVKNISNLIHVIDPLSGQTGSMPAEAFWRDPIRPIITAARSRLTRYIVLGKEAAVMERNVSKKTATRKQRNRLATLTVAKERDLGVNDVQFEERSHLGYLTKAGDVCLGYDLTETQFVDDQAEEMRGNGKLPDVVIVRKLYGGVATGDVNAAKMRMWRLQRLDVDVAESMRTARAAKRDADDNDMDEEDFLREVEADKEMRIKMNLYKSDVVMKSDGAEGSVNGEDMSTGSNPTVADDDEDDQQVKLDELLDGLVLDEGPDQSKQGLGEDYRTDTTFGTGEGEKAAKDGIGFVGREHAGQVRDKDAAKPVSGFVFGKEYSRDDFKFL